jgi:hypothetical protein
MPMKRSDNDKQTQQHAGESNTRKPPDAATADAELEYPEGGLNEADAHGGNAIGVSDR